MNGDVCWVRVRKDLVGDMARREVVRGAREAAAQDADTAGECRIGAGGVGVDAGARQGDAEAGTGGDLGRVERAVGRGDGLGQRGVVGPVDARTWIDLRLGWAEAGA